MALFEKNPNGFDLIITDHMMVHMTGIKLVEKIRASGSNILVIMSTGYPDLVHDKSVMQSGVSEVLLKPFLIKELAAVIYRVMLKAKQ